MKTNKRVQNLQRRALDQKLKVAKIPERPRSGWIKAVRESLLMTTAQLANRLGVSQPVVANMEKREAHKRITLETLEKAAVALNCRLTYALIPIDGSLEKTLTNRAESAAREISRATSHSMRLEDQGVEASETQVQIADLAFELKLKGDRRIWSDKKSKK